MLTQARLKAALDYDPNTGVFRWKVGHARASVGSVAGCVSKASGYRLIRLDGILYRANRLAWLWMIGVLPTGLVDHADGVRSNNRWKNLRELSHRANTENQRRARCDNKTGFLGVFPSYGKFQSQIKVKGRPIHLGTFATPEEAHVVYVAAKREHHEGCTL